jgi:ATPase subunit of ABC transporter with duplicated ATPase domains
VGSHPVLAIVAQTPEVTVDDLLRIVLGGGFVAGLATLIRALTKRGAQVTGSIERTVLLQERIIERQQVDLDEEQQARKRAQAAADTYRHERDDARAVARAYWRSHGPPTDPNLRNIDIGGGFHIDGRGRLPDDP